MLNKYLPYFITKDNHYNSFYQWNLLYNKEEHSVYN